MSDYNIDTAVFWLNKEKNYLMIRIENNEMGVLLEASGFLLLEVLKQRLEALWSHVRYAVEDNIPAFGMG